jgi:CRP-like cAMP-binding protein
MTDVTGTATSEPLRVLRQAYLFRDLSAAELEPLALAAVTRRFGPGEFVYRVGEPATALIVVADGQLKEGLVTVDGDEYIGEVYSAGGVAGEPGLFAVERDRVVDLVAMTPATVLAIPRDRLVAFLLRHPPTMFRMLEGLATHARTAVEDVAHFGYNTVTERVAIKLVELAGTHGEREAVGFRIRLSISQGTLAALVASRRENVNRALASLRRAGLVATEADEVVILDLEGLRRAAAVEEPGHRRNRRPGPSGDAQEMPTQGWKPPSS